MSETEQPHVMTTAERLQKAEEREKKHADYRDRLRRVSVAEQEIPSVWATGEVTKQKLADQYGISTMTVNRILESNGVIQSRVHRLTDAERDEIVAFLKGGTTPEEIMESYGVSKNTVRNIGLKAGVLRPGERKPRRSDEEYERIEELNTMAIQRFGAGIYNLGIGLKAWKKKQRDALKTPGEAQPVDGEGNDVHVPEPSFHQENKGYSPPQPEPPHTEPDAEPGYPVSEPPTPLEQATNEEPDFKF